MATTERALKCPVCSGPLSPGKFARSVVCSYCGNTIQIDPAAVRAERFREAYRAWDSPATHGFSSWLTVGGMHWAPGPLLARGASSDVFLARRARWPTERALLKVARDDAGVPRLENEWSVLRALQESDAPGSDILATRLPQPIVHGRVTAGPHEGRAALLLRWAPGFRHTLEDVRAAYPSGIEPRISVWMWRRVLEVLSSLHAAGFVHGDVAPAHLLVEEGEHGMRLVGFGRAARAGASGATAADDVARSARAMAYVLGGDAATGTVPATVPAPLAGLVGAGTSGVEPWTLRERLGAAARELFGPPVFCPLVMPG